MTKITQACVTFYVGAIQSRPTQINFGKKTMQLKQVIRGITLYQWTGGSSTSSMYRVAHKKVEHTCFMDTVQLWK